jgi:hypothetical protein
MDMGADIELFGSPDRTLLDFCLWGCMESKVYKRKVDTPEEFLARILVAAACINKCEDQPDEKHAIFAHDLRSALRLAVGFLNIYCELYQICHFCVTDFAFKH